MQRITHYSKSQILLNLYTVWLFSIRIYTYLIVFDNNRFIMRKRRYRLVRRSQQIIPGILVTRFVPLLHNRHSQQLGQLSTPPRAYSSRPVFFRLLTVILFPSFLPPPPSLFLDFLSTPLIPLWYLDISFSITCSAFARFPATSFSISLPPFLSLSVPIPFISLSSSRSRCDYSISTNIDSSLTLSTHHLFLFTLSYLLSSVLFSSLWEKNRISIRHSPFFLLILTFLLLSSFVSILHCLDFIYFFRTRIRFDEVGGPRASSTFSHARVGHVVCTLYDDA